MIKLEQQKKEAKVWYEEANTHVKSGNLLKAQSCYDKVGVRLTSDESECY